MSTSPRNGPRIVHAGRGGCGGFTLMEVCLAVGILALIAAAIFTTLESSMTASSELDRSQRRLQSLEALDSWLDHGFRTLTPQSAVTTSPAGTNKNELEVTVRDHPGFTGWADDAIGSLTTVLTLLAQQDGLYTLSMSEVKQSRWEWQTSGASKNPDDWTPLIRDIKWGEWRFYDSRTRTWTSDWTQPTIRPAIIELTLQIADDPEPCRFTFWLPPTPDAGAAGGETNNSETPPPGQ
jgi:type II secretory pathway component PulJ